MEVLCKAIVRESGKVATYSGLLEIDQINEAPVTDISVYRITYDFETPPYINLMENRVEQFTLENEVICTF